MLPLDVASRASILAAGREIERAHGRLDALVNNAAVLIVDPAADRLELLRATFETNVFGPWCLTDVLEPLLRRSAAPVVVNVSSD